MANTRPATLVPKSECGDDQEQRGIAIMASVNMTRRVDAPPPVRPAPNDNPSGGAGDGGKPTASDTRPPASTGRARPARIRRSRGDDLAGRRRGPRVENSIRVETIGPSTAASARTPAPASIARPGAPPGPDQSCVEPDARVDPDVQQVHQQIHDYHRRRNE
jgi:hypothetical protein